MKNLIVTALFLFATYSIQAQKAINKDPNWKVGSIITQNENNIKRIEGENVKGSITNISYKSLKQLIAQVNNGKTRGDAKKNQLKKFKDYAPGGMVVFYFNRDKEAQVNLDKYTFIIKDNSGKEIYKRAYKNKTGKVDNKNGGWYNSSNLQIKYKVSPPFTVEIQEKTASDKIALYKFEVLSTK
jgi:hypothetical protein